MVMLEPKYLNQLSFFAVQMFYHNGIFHQLELSCAVTSVFGPINPKEFIFGFTKYDVDSIHKLI